jgi:hypothetical protein
MWFLTFLIFINSPENDASGSTVSERAQSRLFEGLREVHHASQIVRNSKKRMRKTRSIQYQSMSMNFHTHTHTFQKTENIFAIIVGHVGTGGLWMPRRLIVERNGW